jgi:hypothetical protein
MKVKTKKAESDKINKALLKALESILKEWKEDLSERGLDEDELPEDGSWMKSIRAAEKIVYKAKASGK